MNTVDKILVKLPILMLSVLRQINMFLRVFFLYTRTIYCVYPFVDASPGFATSISPVQRRRQNTFSTLLSFTACLLRVNFITQARLVARKTVQIPVTAPERTSAPPPPLICCRSSRFVGRRGGCRGRGDGAALSGQNSSDSRAPLKCRLVQVRP